MIINASRRTDIPAFYSRWFMNRVRDGYCTVPNPYNSKQISCVQINPRDIDVIVFWTRNSRPMIRHLNELDERGFRYYFQNTVLNYPEIIDANTPSLLRAVDNFRLLSDRIGPAKAIWRYDPIVFSEKTNTSFHLENFAKLAELLQGYTNKCVISIVDMYKKAVSRMRTLEREGSPIANYDPTVHGAFFKEIVRIAKERKINVQSCAEKYDLGSYGIQPNKCVDDELIKYLFNIRVENKKDKSQREECGCVASRDIGMYDSCIYGCKYCYATTNFDKARHAIKKHNPDSPSLLGYYETDTMKSSHRLLDLFAQDNKPL